MISCCWATYYICLGSSVGSQALAWKVLAIPATPAQSKRLLSKAGRVEPAIIPWKQERRAVALSAHCVARNHGNWEQGFQEEVVGVEREGHFWKLQSKQLELSLYAGRRDNPCLSKICDVFRAHTCSFLLTRTSPQTVIWLVSHHCWLSCCHGVIFPLSWVFAVLPFLVGVAIKPWWNWSRWTNSSSRKIYTYL